MHPVRFIVRLFLVIVVIAIVAVFAINAYVKNVGGQYLRTPEEAANLGDVDCVLVLGCGVRPDGTPSPMLRDRLQEGIDLFTSGVAPKLLMSGDHSQDNYNEVGTMKDWAIQAGVPSADVFMDHAGLSTYESMRRARDVFGAQRVVVVSQGYHLYRSLYVARALGLDAYGVCADGENYAGQLGRDVREVFARVKDFFTAVVQPNPTFLGDSIRLQGSGDVTND